MPLYYQMIDFQTSVSSMKHSKRKQEYETCLVHDHARKNNGTWVWRQKPFRTMKMLRPVESFYELSYKLCQKEFFSVIIL